MTTKLTPEQRDELNQHGNRPVPVIDPVTNAVYFLVAGDLFERFKGLLDAEQIDVEETYAAQSLVAGQSGWDDPEMDIYNDYDSQKSQQ